jgi:hypothetical protein
MAKNLIVDFSHIFMEVHDFETQHPHKAQVDSQGQSLSKSPPIDVNEYKTLRLFFAMIFFN